LTCPNQIDDINVNANLPRHAVQLALREALLARALSSPKVLINDIFDEEVTDNFEVET